MAKKNSKKLFIVRKYIWAISKDKNHPVEDVWVDDEWKKSSNSPKDAVGFYVPDKED